MVSLLLWFMLLSAGGVLCAAVWGKRYEEILPVTCCGIVAFLFLWGIVGQLKAGAVCTCVVGAGCYIFAAVWIYKKRRFKEFARNFFTPAFCIVLFWFGMSCHLNMGKMASSWDEFSHWADIAKVVSTIDDFGTAPGSYSAFPSYPPGMVLFQYLLEKLYTWTSGNVFSEWRIYVAYQMFAFAFMIPFFKDLKFKNVITTILSVVTIFLCPLVFYNTFYTRVYIDPFLGIVSGTGLAAVFLCKQKDIFYTLRIFLSCVMLVLAKDAGLLFAVFLALAYVLDMMCADREVSSAAKKVDRGRWLKSIYSIVSMVMCLAVPKYLWSLHLKMRRVEKSFSAPINFKQLFEVVLRHDTSYRSTVWKEYWSAVWMRTVSLGDTDFEISYFGIMILFIILLVALTHEYAKKGERNYIYQRKRKIWLGIIITQFIIYVVGICVSYMFKFSEYEATRLASFGRYINVVFLAVYIVLIMLVLTAVQNAAEAKWFIGAAVCCVMMLVSPRDSAYDYIRGTSVKNSINSRYPYKKLCELVEEVVPDNSHIYLVSQEDTGYDYWVMKFSMRPNRVNANCTWSIGEAFYEGDIWTKEIDAREWQTELVEDYDYVALYKINDYFIDNFSTLFADSRELQENSLYRVNKETMLLEKCK